MASIKKLDERRYKVTVSNGYRPNGKKSAKQKRFRSQPAFQSAVFPNSLLMPPRNWNGASKQVLQRMAR